MDLVVAGSKLFSFGGCVYRMQVDGRHAASLALLASISNREDNQYPKLAEIDYMHTSNLPQGRSLWLRRQMWNQDTRHDSESRKPSSLSWAISCDGDTTFDPLHLAKQMERVTGQVAMGIAPVRIGGTEGLCNINITPEDETIQANLYPKAPDFGRRAFADDLKRVMSGDRLITSGGFGLVVFNLDWFRSCWPLPEPERVSIDTGEDIEFCRSVRSRGGLIEVLNVKTDHFAFGEKQTR